MRALFKIGDKSLAVKCVMLLSDEPSISQMVLYIEPDKLADFKADAAFENKMMNALVSELIQSKNDDMRTKIDAFRKCSNG